MTRRKTDGERIAEKGRVVTQHGVVSCFYPQALAARIDRLIRKRMAEAWEDGWCHKTAGEKWDDNPYRGRRSK